MSERPRAVLELWPELLAVAAGSLLFLPSLRFDLVFDDKSLIGIHGPIWLGREWLPYRPLRYGSLWLDHLIGSGRAGAFHLTNVVLHASGVLILARLVRGLGANALATALAALMFAVHPLSVEVVAYVAGRRDLLATVLGLASIWLWTSPSGRSAGALALVLLGVSAKESAILYFPVLGLASLTGNGPSLRRALGPLMCGLAAGLFLPVAYGARGPVLPEGSAVEVATIAGRLTSHYAAGIVWPAALSVEYPHLACGASCAEGSGASAIVGVAILLLLVTAAAMLTLARLRSGRVAAVAAPSAFGFACAWLAIMAVALATVIGRHEPGADRHAYPVLAALAAALAVSMSQVRQERSRRLAAAALVAWVVGLGSLSVDRLPDWRNERALWTATVRTAPTSPRVHHNLAGVLVEAGEVRRASRHLRRALRLNPDYVPSLVGLATIACSRGKQGSATVLAARARLHGSDASALAEIEAGCQPDARDE
jgi:hypothetical protein